jgi:excisionase family DNA binding protein
MADPHGAVCAAIRLDAETTKWLAFAILELERNAPRDALQLPPNVQKTFDTVVSFARRDADAARRAFESVENPDIPIESGATVAPMTTSEAARALGVSTTRVAQMAASGELKASKADGRWAIDRESVAAAKASRGLV